MLTRRHLLVGTAVALPAAFALPGMLGRSKSDSAEEPLPRDPYDGARSPPRRFVFKRPDNGAGGFVTSVDIDRNTGELACTTDVFNGGFRSPGEQEWTMMFTADNLPRERFDPYPPRKHNVGRGVYGFAYAPGTAGVGYAAWRGDLYRFENRKPIPTKFVDQNMQANTGPDRRFHPVIAIHPSDDRTLAVACNGGAVAFSRDGFETWDWLDLPPGIPGWAKTPPKSLVAWLGDELLIHVAGHGAFLRAADGTIRKIEGGPLNSSGLKVMPSGDLWTCHYRFNAYWKSTEEQRAMLGIWRLRDGQWTQFMAGRELDQIAVDPFDEKRMIATDENSGKWWTTTTGPEGFKAIGNEWRGPGETPWLSDRKLVLYPAEVEFHPLIKDQIVITDGTGIARAEFPSFGGLVLNDFSNGIHELVATCGLSHGQKATMILGTMDKGAWRVRQDTTVAGDWSYAAEGNTPNANAVTHLRSLDHATDDPDFVVGLFHRSGGVPGYSEDWGRTWKALPPRPDGGRWLPGGCIVAASRRDILLMEGNNGRLWRIDLDAPAGTQVKSEDMGTGTQIARQINAYYVHRKMMATCRERPGTFAMVLNRTWNPELMGLWLRTPDGRWEQRIKGYIKAPGQKVLEGAQFWQARLEAVPGHPGEWLYARSEGKGKDTLLWLTEDGARVRSFPVSGLSSFAFGKGLGERPAVYAFGIFNGVRGLYASFDWFTSDPQLISRFPANSIDSISAALGLVGDMTRTGRGAIGFAGNNWAIFEPQAV